MTRPTIEEAERRLANLPSLKATLVGIIIGIGISVFAQLILKPYSFQSRNTVNGTVLVTYFGSQQAGEIAATTYYFFVLVGLVGCVFVWWFVQKRLTGLSGKATKTIEHGTDS